MCHVAHEGTGCVHVKFMHIEGGPVDGEVQTELR